MTFMGDEFRTEQHFVAKCNLKRWATPDAFVWTYRTLVSHPNVPVWKRQRLSGIAKHDHLYTRVVAGRETDEVERWLADEIESPAEAVLEKIERDSSLTATDWAILLKFVIAQDARTPSQLITRMRQWDITIPPLINETLKGIRAELESGRIKTGRAVEDQTADDLPIRVRKEPVDDNLVELTAEVLAGRSLWLWEVKRAVRVHVKYLHKLNWTILRPPVGMEWLTSDSPVVRMNFNSPSDFNFGGGWGSPGTDIFMPLDPNHLLYTQVGGRRPQTKYERMPLREALIIQEMICKHAHRLIFATRPTDEVKQWRPRVEDHAAFLHEAEQWRRWPQEQSAAEIAFQEKVQAFSNTDQPSE
jgi:hypothetical protein